MDAQLRYQPPDPQNIIYLITTIDIFIERLININAISPKGEACPNVVTPNTGRSVGSPNTTGAITRLFSYSITAPPISLSIISPL